MFKRAWGKKGFRAEGTPARRAFSALRRSHGALLFLFAELLAFAAAQSALARITPTTLGRNLEPIVLKGSAVPELNGIAIDSLHAYVYRADSSKWVPIPFQIDETVDGDYFTPDDGLLDSNDEIVLYSADFGDRVPDGIWLDDPLARRNYRVEIEARDPLSPDSSAAGWAYIFVCPPDSANQGVRPYFTVDTATDRVISRYFGVGHNSNGLMVNGWITHEGGGNNFDIIDRQKQRVKGNYKYGFITYNYKVTENNVEKEGIDWVIGPVRVIRHVRAKIVYSVLEEDMNLTEYYYPRAIYVGGEDTIDPDLGVYHLRQSLDLNANATGMRFYNPYNPKNDETPIIIDTKRDDVDPTIVVPGKNWTMVTGNPGTILTLMDIPDVGTRRKLYYRDYPSGTSDGTDDTGDGKSYGDIGIYISGDNIVGPASFHSWTYFLPANRQRSLGDTLLSYWENPLIITTTPQRVDSVGPARVSDLIASAEPEGAVRLTWTAPGDDGNVGTAERYDIRYSLDPPPMDSYLAKATAPRGDYDMDSWFRDARSIADTTRPAPAGTREIRIYGGFSVGKRYYFALRTYDDADHVSPISNVASIIPVPVELASFAAHVLGDSVVLTWATASETRNVGFGVERAQGDRKPFEEIGFVHGAGTTAETHEYTFADHPPAPGTYRYRLRQVDTDGTVHYSSVLRVTVAPTDFQLLTAFPTPFNAQTRVRFRTLTPGRVQLRIFDTAGRLVWQTEQHVAEPGYHDFVWAGRNSAGQLLPSGVYFVRFLSPGGTTAITKVVLVR